MYKMKTIFTSFFFLLSFLGSDLLAQSTLKLDLVGLVGTKVYSTDLGNEISPNAEVISRLYWSSEQKVNFFVNGKIGFHSLSAADSWSEIDYNFLDFSLGLGLHLKEKIFASANYGYLNRLSGTSKFSKQTDNYDIVGNNSFYMSMRLNASLLEFKRAGIAIMASVEAGKTFTDIDFLNRVSDNYEGTPFIAINLGVRKTFGCKEKSTSAKLMRGE